MATGNKWLTKVILCEKQIACDGEAISERRKDKSMCGKCAAALKKRNQPQKPLRGAKLYSEDEDV